MAGSVKGEACFEPSERLMPLSKAQIVKLAAAIAVIAAALIIMGGHLDVRLQIERAVAWVRAAGPLPLFAASALLPAAGSPLSAFTVVAGPVFGPTLGVGTVVGGAILAVTLNVTLSYWVAARALRPVIERV